MDNQRLFLLDAFALIFRAYYALIRVPRITSAGFNTSAIFGFVNTLEELLRKEKPSHIAVCFDPQGPTFRHKASEEYKSERAEMPEDIRLSLPYIHRIIEAYNIPTVVCDGYEADDVIGTLATQAEKLGFTTYMMTPDKDFGQLVTPSILQYKPSYRGQDFELRGPEEVCARYGLARPRQVIDLLALMGDKIDNIPGCPGVGEVTARKLIAEFDNVDNLLAHTDSLKGALKKKIETNREQIEFSRFLATIVTDAPVELKPDEFRISEPDREKLFAIFDELEFKSLKTRIARRLNEEHGKAAPAQTEARQGSLFDFDDDGAIAAEEAEEKPANTEFEIKDIHTVKSREDVTVLDRRLAEAGRVAMAMTCTGDNDMTAEPTAISLAFDSGECHYIPSASVADAMPLLLDALARPDLRIISSDIKRDYVVAARRRNDGAVPVVNYRDISVMHYLLQPEQRRDIVTLAEVYLNRTIPVPPPTTGKRAPAPLPPESLCAMAMAALELEEPFMKDIREAGLEPLLEDIELPMVRVLAEMEIAGVRIDVHALDAAADDMRSRLAILEKEIYALAGTEFNIGSPSKVGEILFDRLHLDDKAKKTKRGQYSTTEEILSKLAPMHPIVDKILTYRSMKKLLTTYLLTLPDCINPATGRIHTTYNQTVTSTGRISSSNPNLQNIPVREGEGREIRRAFIPSEGNVFLSADYSQIELRLVADFAREHTMTEAFLNNKDIHAITASKIYRIPLEDVSADQRRHAKTANFGILYGISPFGLASRLGIPRGEAKALIDGYFETFPDIRKYLESVLDEARSSGMVRTAFGRRRFTPDINSHNPTVRGYAERNAINAPIQGTAADIIKKAMVDIDNEFRAKSLKSKMIMQVHDELNFDVVPEELPAVQEIVTRCMEGAWSGKVPLTASMGIADNWLDAH